MTIAKTIEIQSDRRLVVDLPSDLPTGRAKIEITITPENIEIIAKRKSAFGCLHRFADPQKIQGEEGSWTRAILEKYAKN